MNISPKSIYNWYSDTIRNPKYRWWMILGSLLYLVSPIDIAPDLFPIVGQIDDVIILTLLFTELSKLFGDYVKSRKENIGSSTEKNVTKDAEVKTVDVDAVSLD
ncbi:MAG: YkvA family protein [Prochloraceae cyanobacterium]|nr:YkvA family protein [Prochloraceae cyanobacterium]